MSAHKNSPDTKAALFALIIGINEFASTSIGNLIGPVADALDVEAYLRERHSVPQDHIRKLCDAEATRDAIIKAFGDLKNNPNIKENDPIVIFFAGHGGETQAPDGWHAEGGSTQFLVPYDVLVRDGEIFNTIPDRTLGALLEDLADAKGNNITVILDCCHSHSGSRDHKGNKRVAKLKGKLPAHLDSDILASRSAGRDPFVHPIFVHHSLRSHVLLSACGANEVAQEHNGRGDFTKALIETLRTLDAGNVIYKHLIGLLPNLPSSDQNPHCEGHHKDRLLFSTKAAADSLIVVKKVGKMYKLMAGEAQGITPDSRFDVYPDRIPKNLPLGSLYVTEVEPIQAELAPIDGTTPELPDLAYARLVYYAVPEVLRLEVHFSKDFEKEFIDKILDVASIGLAAEAKSTRFHVTDEESVAGLLVDVEDIDGSRKAVFRSRIQYAQETCLERLALDTHAHSAPDISRVLRQVGHWNWHFRRQGSGEFRNRVLVEFYRVEKGYDTYQGLPMRMWNPIQPIQNLLVNGVIDIHANPTHRFGMKLNNNTDRDLHPYLFYFGVKSQSIVDYKLGSTAKDNVDPPLNPGYDLSIGYGANGGAPFTFKLPDGATAEDRPGFFKIFLTTSSTEIGPLMKTSPYEPSREPDRDEPQWDALTVKVIERFSA